MKAGFVGEGMCMRTFRMFVALFLSLGCSEIRGQPTTEAKHTSESASRPSVTSESKPLPAKQASHTASSSIRRTRLANASRLSDQEWRTRLTPLQYRILRQKGTEPRGGPLLREKREGVFHCAGCGQHLYSSKSKYDSGSGWPSFTQSFEGAIKRVPDHSHGMVRVELVCSHCGGHLGHVFEDGPPPTYQRHCINSAALEFEPKMPKNDKE